MRVAGEVPERAEIEIGQQPQFPVGQHIRSDTSQVRARQHVHHLQPIGRAHFHCELDHDRVIGRVAPLGQLRHHQMLVDQESQRIGIGLRESQLLAAFLGQTTADFAVVARVALAEIMEQ